MLRTPVSCVILFALVVLALAAPAATLADDPSAATADTLGVADITASTATFQATINPHGLPTVAHFEYGPTDEVLQSTQDVAVGAGTTDIPFSVPVTGLAPSQHYYVVVYATNSAGGEYGSALGFTTPPVAPPPTPVAPHPRPVLQRILVSAGSVTQFSAMLHVKVTGSSGPVTVTASTVGPDGVAIPSGPVTVPGDGDATMPVSGLQPNTQYRWTATVTSAAGTSPRSGGFRTLRLVGMRRPVVSPKSVEYGGEVTVTGSVPGGSGLGVALSQQPFPFAVPFAPVPRAAGTIDAGGAYRFTTRALRRTRYGVSVAGYVPPGPGNTAQVWVSARLDANVKRARRHRFVVAGRYWPDVPSEATLYRVGHGRAGVAITPASAGGNSRTFRFAARNLKPGSYEVRLVMPSSTGIKSTHSELLKIPRR